MKPKREETKSIFDYYMDDKRYLMVLERLKNTYYGNPKFKVIIINLETGENATYRFQGHYYSEYKESVWILFYHLNML